MEHIPVEILSHVIGFLDILDQMKVAVVNSRWRAASKVCLRQRQRLSCDDLGGLRDVFVRSYRNNDKNEKLRALLRLLPALRSLDLKLWMNFSVDVVSDHCRHLEELNLKPFRLTVPAIKRLRRRCPRLVSLILPNDIEPTGLATLLRLMPGLHRLALEDSTLSADCVELLPTGLRSLQLDCCCVEELPVQPNDRWPELRELIFNMAEPGGSLTTLVAGCPRLERLEIDCPETTDDLLRTLPDQLQDLDLSFCDQLTEAALADCLGRLKQLRTLGLVGVDVITDVVLERLAAVGTLRKLWLGPDLTVLHGNQYKPFHGISLDAVQRLVLGCPSLTVLSMDVHTKELLEALITGLVRHLGPDRNLTLSVCGYRLEEIDQSVLPCGERPLRVESAF